MFKDPYIFDFLGPAEPRKVREVEPAIVEEIRADFLVLEKEAEGFFNEIFGGGMK